MRRYIAGALFLVLVGQSPGAALAGPVGPVGGRGAIAGIVAPSRAVAATVGYPRSSMPLTRHTPLPRRPMPDYLDPRRYARFVLKPRGTPVAEHATRPIDLVKLRKAQGFNLHEVVKGRLVANRREQRSRLHRARPLTTSASTTGILPWWTYATRTLPGIGEALVNIANLNFLITADDVDVPEGGIDLAFQRVYNSQSEHDANNDDGSTPSVFGNRWTNNLDLHLAWAASSGNANSGTVSVYTADGARDDYGCEINVVETCTSLTTGVHDLLGTTDVTGGVACQFQWTRKSGESYIFNAPYAACGKLQGAWGRLTFIYGRNASFYVALTYSWSPDASNPENLTQIEATHEPDGNQLKLTFGQIAGTSITELMRITRPDGEFIDYQYDSYGRLTGVDKPMGVPVLAVSEPIPTAWPNGTQIPAGNLPEVYDYEQTGLLETCGPRAAIGILHNNSPTDGACVDFDYTVSPNELSDWWTRGVLNPTPRDDVTISPIQNGPSTQFVQWDDTAFFANNEGSDCNPLSQAGVSDPYGHSTTWCYDTSGRVIETVSAVSSSTFLGTEQDWDDNNNLVSVTDARGYKTDIAYDPNGNTIEVSLPSQSTSNGTSSNTIRPTSLYDYDPYNNLTYYCDPANNANNGWMPSQSDTLCESSGSTHYMERVYNTSDANEPYGCIHFSYTPNKYQRTFTYGGGCGVGMPTEVQGTSFSQNSQKVPSRQPTQLFTYNTNGTLNTYDAGNGAWQLAYANNGMNRLGTATDADGVLTHWCYNLDGSLFFSESAYQGYLDGSPGCPTTTQLANGNATPPPYATAYGYDPEGDVATEARHHGCTLGNLQCVANSPSNWHCNGATVSNGTTCKYYDGLDRLVEVRQPWDPTYDLYMNPWLTRYLYDLSDQTGDQANFDGQSFAAFGNLFETQEYLTPGGQAVNVDPLKNDSVHNNTYVATNATAFDGLDRPVAKYSLVYPSGSSGDDTLNTETLTWDSTPLGGGDVAGYLGKDCNQLGHCQQFDYWPDGELKTLATNNGSVPTLSYLYDPDARIASITSAALKNPQLYSYTVDGLLSTATDASGGGGVTSPAVLTHHYYPDGTESSLDVSSAALTQVGLFDYSYRKDGLLADEQINQASLSGTADVADTYTDAGRILTRTESGPGAWTPTTYTYDTNTTTGTKSATGLLTKEQSPGTTLTFSLSQFPYSYSAEGELEWAGTSSPGCTAANFTYSLRGELVGWSGCPSSSGGALMANGVSVSGQTDVPTYTWDGNMGVLVNETGTCDSSECETVWSFDLAGRMTGEKIVDGLQSADLSRCYDAQNHLLVTYKASSTGTCAAQTTGAVIAWGPNGHPITIGTYDPGGSLDPETLHWNGDQMLFATRGSGASVILDDVKVDTQGDILPNDPTKPGLTYYDRAPSGTVMGCHNGTGASFQGLGDSWGYRLQIGEVYTTPCAGSSGKMPTSIDWYGSSMITAQGEGGAIGQGGVLGMPRIDGLTDGYDTIQGVRAYDSNVGIWTTPDVFPGDVDDPSSQKSYVWNGNDPMDYSDTTGYVANWPPFPNPDTGPSFPSPCVGLCRILDSPPLTVPPIIYWVTVHRPLPQRRFVSNPLTGGGELDPTSWPFLLGLASMFVPGEAGEGAVGSLAERTLSRFDMSITRKGARMINVATDLTRTEFEANLIANGYAIIKQTEDVTVYSNGSGSFYSIYTRNSTEELGVQYVGPDGTKVRFTLEGP